MRQALGVLALLALLPPQPARADDAAARLIGSWRPVFQIRAVGEEGPPRDVFGPRPFGRLILTPAHTMAAFISRPDRKPPANEAEAAALLSSMLAYTGRFRLDGDTFGIRTGEGPSGIPPGKLTVGALGWERKDRKRLTRAARRRSQPGTGAVRSTTRRSTRLDT